MNVEHFSVMAFYWPSFRRQNANQKIICFNAKRIVKCWQKRGYLNAKTRAPARCFTPKYDTQRAGASSMAGTHDNKNNSTANSDGVSTTSNSNAHEQGVPSKTDVAARNNAVATVRSGITAVTAECRARKR